MRAHGASAERTAAHFLQTQGLNILQRNYQCKVGELDIVAEEGDCLVFVEVRQRSHSRYGGALGSVDVRKQQRLARAASHFLLKHPQWQSSPCRFDVIALQRPQSPLEECQWVRNAFTL